MSQHSCTRRYKLSSFGNAKDSVLCETFFKQTLYVSDGEKVLTVKRNTVAVQFQITVATISLNKTHLDDIRLKCDFISDFSACNSHNSKKDNSSKQ